MADLLSLVAPQTARKTLIKADGRMDGPEYRLQLDAGANCPMHSGSVAEEVQHHLNIDDFLPEGVRVIPHYEIQILDKVGDGTTGQVFRARLNKVEDVVIKVPWNSDHITEMMQEIKVAAMVGRHPNMVPMVGVCTHTIIPMIVTELQGGGTLDDLLAERSKPRDRFWKVKTQKQIPERTCIPWMRDLCAALAFLHTQSTPWIHRDVKPANLFFSADRKTLRLGDFGLCRATTSSIDGAQTRAAEEAMSGCVGTYRYMAPEVWSRSRGAERGEQYDAKADIYSAGMCMWACRMGVRPFNRMPDQAAADLVARGKLQLPIATLGSAQIAMAIASAVNLDPAHVISAIGLCLCYNSPVLT